jgi:anaerobic magnesium-protoporphyrin IX monomethyl ester cyclase
MLYSNSALDNLANLVKNDDLIGISVMSNHYNSIKDLTIKLKRKFPDKPIVWGGIHPTVMPEECIEVADYICISEGEISFLDLCQNLAKGKSAENIPGIWSKTDDRISRNNPGNVITDLDQIPPPDYDLENNHIILSSKKSIPITITRNNLHKFLGVTYWTLYTRGCPFSCSYCCNNALRKIHKDLTKFRAKSTGNIIKELSAIKDRFPFIKYIYFVDDTLFALPEKVIEEFSEDYKKYVSLPFIVSGVQPSVFSENKFDSLVAGGLLRVRMGIQTGSTRILDIYERKQNNETIIKVTNSLQKHSNKLMMPNYDIILDNPWETLEDKLQTINLLGKISFPFSLNLFSLVFFPGTSLYFKAMKEQIINERTEYGHYLNYESSYLNLIIALFGFFKVPKWLLNLLLSKRFVNTKRKFPVLHSILYNLILFRKGIYSIFKKEFSMFPPSLQLLFCKFLKLRTK